jgi:long-chain fatty acid transport protein
MISSIRARLGTALLALTAGSALGTALCGHARAAGFALREGSTDWIANDFAGDTAKGYDAATVWANPAGMTLLTHNEIDGSLNGIFPSINFSGANFVGPGITTPGTTGGNLIQSAATGGVYGVWTLSPDLRLGFAGEAPFGERLSNPTAFVGRYQSLVSAITDEQFTLSGAYRVNSQVSIGGGPVLDFFSTRLTQALNTGPTAALTGDPVADLRGYDVSVGFNLGLLYQATPSLRFGIDYRSRIQHDFTGTQSIYVPPLITALSPVTAAGLGALNSAAGSKITLPDSATFGAYWQVTAQLALMADVAWTDWSLLKSIAIVPTTPGLPTTTIPENWRDTASVSIGANYRLTRQLMLQAGAGFDQSPVTDSNRNTRVPDSNRYELAVGAQYDVLPNTTLMAAYLHSFFASAPVTTQANATSGVLVGTYTAAADVASLGVKIRF